MKCIACRSDRPDVRLVVRAHRSGFTYSTRRFHACLSCFPEPAAPAALPPPPPSLMVGVAGSLSVGSEPGTDAPSAPSGAPPRRATSAVTADGGSGHSLAPVCRGDVTAGRDRHLESPLGRGTDSRAESRPTVTTRTCHMEGYADEVGTGDWAVAPPAHMCVPPGRRPGSFEGPGRVSPGDVVGREAGGR